MIFETIKFPVEGNVQELVHFLDARHAYAFTFASPYRYKEPADLRQKKAFLIGMGNPFQNAEMALEKIESYFILHEGKAAHPDKNVRGSIKRADIYGKNGSLSGRIEMIIPKNHFFSFAGNRPNLIYDQNNQIIGFCHYDMQNAQKSVYALKKGQELKNDPLTLDELDALEKAGGVARLFTYQTIEVETSVRSKMEALFSPSKKSQFSNNRISMRSQPENEEMGMVFLTSLFAFFWATYIDLPVVR